MVLYAHQLWSIRPLNSTIGKFKFFSMKNWSFIETVTKVTIGFRRCDYGTLYNLLGLGVPEPILEFKGKHQYIQKGKRASYFGNKSWFDFSTSKIQNICGKCFKQLSVLQTFLWYIALVYSFLFFLKGFEKTWWW